MKLGGVTLLYLRCDSRMRRHDVGAGADTGESHTRLWTRQLDFAVEEDKKAENFLGIRWGLESELRFGSFNRRYDDPLGTAKILAPFFRDRYTGDPGRCWSLYRCNSAAADNRDGHRAGRGNQLSA